MLVKWGSKAYNAVALSQDLHPFNIFTHCRAPNENNRPAFYINCAHPFLTSFWLSLNCIYLYNINERKPPLFCDKYAKRVFSSDTSLLWMKTKIYVWIDKIELWQSAQQNFTSLELLPLPSKGNPKLVLPFSEQHHAEQFSAKSALK